MACITATSDGRRSPASSLYHRTRATAPHTSAFRFPPHAESHLSVRPCEVDCLRMPVARQPISARLRSPGSVERSRAYLSASDEVLAKDRAGVVDSSGARSFDASSQAAPLLSTTPRGLEPEPLRSPRTLPSNARTLFGLIVLRGGQRLRCRNTANALTSSPHHAGDGVLTCRMARALPRIEIRLERSAEVRAPHEVAMRTRKGMLDQRLRALRLSYARIELAKPLGAVAVQNQ